MTFVTDSGEVIQDHYVYTAFGMIVGHSGGTPNHRTFVGRFGYQDDTGSGVYFADARYYEADTGRWLTNA